MSINSSLSAASASWNALPKPVQILATVAAGAALSGAIGSLMGVGGFTYIATTCVKTGALAEAVNQIAYFIFKKLDRKNPQLMGLQIALCTSIAFTVEFLTANPGEALSKAALQSLKIKGGILGAINAFPLYARELSVS